jgi:hypothetical protein
MPARGEADDPMPSLKSISHVSANARGEWQGVSRAFAANLSLPPPANRPTIALATAVRGHPNGRWLGVGERGLDALGQDEAIPLRAVVGSLGADAVALDLRNVPAQASLCGLQLRAGR